MKIALSIAGSDSCGGAGIQLDLKVFQALGVYGVSVVTALTAQNTRGVERVHHVPRAFVAAQFDALAGDLPIAAAKTGMLAREQVVEAVADRVQRRSIPNLVIDPVILAKDGTPLLNSRGLRLLKTRLLPRAVAITPNVPEAEALTGVKIQDETSLYEAARHISGLGVRAVIIKGGHLPREPLDTLFLDGEFTQFPGSRIEGIPVHGTGCLYSAALTARLAVGDDLPEACRIAKETVTRAIINAVSLGKGSRLAIL